MSSWIKTADPRDSTFCDHTILEYRHGKAKCFHCGHKFDGVPKKEDSDDSATHNID